ncbi:hypothetical protein K435DRAFT_779941 [Dendrothele bispora CBS 962.96]|uniref:Heterokaryon incompatibility domain-containing protein n=1 Tax=Dendrothele bispora (strain CBS 962.96) TaxID=1314807 RepID=A0A4S8LV47_DENBC|nr:hypothetical protein K435DRAFT_779941 [Dendrothele bispora CBS 962.96]
MKILRCSCKAPESNTHNSDDIKPSLIRNKARFHRKPISSLSTSIPSRPSRPQLRFMYPSFFNREPTIFPFSLLSDQEVKLLFVSDTVPPYPAYRCVRTEGGKLSSTKNETSCDVMAPINICPHRFIDAHTLKLIEFYKDAVIPPYAILSHRWGEEVVYDEFLHPRRETKAKSRLGYQKIKATCQQARKDGIHYIWVDTCCIKQGDPADVSANITSMYAYNQNAEVCYVYLADVSKKSEMFDRVILGKHLAGTEWLERGWTLQARCAPNCNLFQ